MAIAPSSPAAVRPELQLGISPAKKSGIGSRLTRAQNPNATPNPILAGEGVTIYGQLNRAPVGGQTIVLYHHIAGSGRGYTPVSHTTPA